MNKIQWFGSLPTLKHNKTGTVEKRCVCGESFFYNSDTSQMKIFSWIDLHYSHGAETSGSGAAETIDNPFYDFSRPIRFTKDGFELFAREFGLTRVPIESSPERSAYRDRFGNTFVFRSAPADSPQSLYRTFVPELSRVNSGK